MASENELEIILSLQDRVTKEFKEVVDKVKKGFSEVEDSTKKVEKTSEKANKGMIKGFQDQIRPINSLRFTIMRVGLIWGATLGLMIKGVVDLGKEIDNLDRLSIKLGMSASDLSIRFYGFNIATEQTRVGAAATQNALSAFGEALLRIKMGTAEVVGELAILQKQYGTLNLFLMGQGAIKSPSISREDAVSQILEENQAKRLASKEGQALLLEEDSLFRQLALSKVEHTRSQFEQQVELMRFYGIDTARIQEEFAVREAQNEEIQMNLLIAQRYEAQNKLSVALGYRYDAQLAQFKKIWGSDGKVVQEFVKTQTVLAKKKHWDILMANVNGVIGAFDQLGAALQGASEISKDFAKAAAVVALAMAIVHTAEGVTRAFKDYPWPFSMVVAGIVAAAGAIQIATISAQRFAEGGRPPLGTPSIVGERGPELFVPDSLGTIVPNHILGGNRQTFIRIEVNNPQVRSDEDINKLTEEISLRLSREAERI